MRWIVSLPLAMTMFRHPEAAKSISGQVLPIDSGRDCFACLG
jgi:hypothetical protein